MFITLKKQLNKSEGTNKIKSRNLVELINKPENFALEKTNALNRTFAKLIKQRRKCEYMEKRNYNYILDVFNYQITLLCRTQYLNEKMLIKETLFLKNVCSKT